MYDGLGLLSVVPRVGHVAGPSLPELSSAEAFTVTLWFAETTAGQSRTLFRQGSPTSNTNAVGALLQGGDLTFLLSTGTDQGLVVSNYEAVAPLGRFHHAAFVFDGLELAEDRARVYLDGVAAPGTATGIGPLSPDVAGNGFVLGHPGATFPSALDEVRVFDRALTEHEIVALYERARVRPPPDHIVRIPFDGSTTTEGTVLVPSLTGTPTYDDAPVDTGVVLTTSDGVAYSPLGSLGGWTRAAISLWVRDDAPSSGGSIFNVEAGSACDIQLDQSSGMAGDIGVEVGNGDSVGGSFPGSGTLLGDGGWHHLLLIYDGTSPTLSQRAALVVDGVLLGYSGEDLPSSLCDLSSTPIAIGGPTEPWAGAIDDLRLYDRSLTGPEILALEDEGESP